MFIINPVKNVFIKPKACSTLCFQIVVTWYITIDISKNFNIHTLHQNVFFPIRKTKFYKHSNTFCCQSISHYTNQLLRPQGSHQGTDSILESSIDKLNDKIERYSFKTNTNTTYKHNSETNLNPNFHCLWRYHLFPNRPYLPTWALKMKQQGSPRRCHIVNFKMAA